MAWRDSRRQRGQLLLFITSVVVGVAALVAINTFSYNLQKDISREAKTLLGADLILQGIQEPSPALLRTMDSLGGQRAQLKYTISMAYFPKSDATRMVQIRALEGPFPFYGKISTEPAGAAQSFIDQSGALVDRSLMRQFRLEVGDSLKLGEQSFAISGTLLGAPGRSGFAGATAPAVYIPMDLMDRTGLIQYGSRVYYQYAFLLTPEKNPEAIAKSMREQLNRENYSAETVERRKKSLGQAFSDMARFLNLVGFVALMLGCIGVASAVNLYIRKKLRSIAILRTLGLKQGHSFLIYLIQLSLLGLVGATMGVLLGSVLQTILPLLFADLLPVQDISRGIAPFAVLQGLVVGLSVTLLFGLLPLIQVRNSTPLLSIRGIPQDVNYKDPVRGLVMAGILLFVFGFAFWQTSSLIQAGSFVTAGILALGVLYLAARMTTWLLKRFFPRNWAYTWRQAIANLYRPNNQTMTLMTVIGLGAALLSTLLLIQQLLLQQIAFAGTADQPNMIIFDIQPDQLEGITTLTHQEGMPVIQQVPIVTMRINELDGLTKRVFDRDTSSSIPRWAFSREYRVTYRDTLIETEEIIEGDFGRTHRSGTPVQVSLESGIAEELQVGIGDPILWNVQGALVESVVGSIRKVNWQRIQTNFFVVFPTGVLEEAPQFDVVVTRVKDETQSASFQTALIKQFPNVSVVDLDLILNTVEKLINKVRFVIQFMALFSILTGLLVLVSAVLQSQSQRKRESALLRTLGATSKQVLRINAIEFLLLGLIASVVGVGLSVFAAWAMAYFSFGLPFRPNWLPLLALLLGIGVLTWLTGRLYAGRYIRVEPNRILRGED